MMMNALTDHTPAMAMQHALILKVVSCVHAIPDIQEMDLPKEQVVQVRKLTCLY